LPSVKNIFGTNPDVNLTARFALIMMVAAFNGFNVRTDDMHLFRNINKNPLFLIIGFCIFVGTFLIVNFGGDLFQVVPLNRAQWVALFVLAFLIIPLDLIRKLLFNK
jgi:magnesium-transporting ATPase (P-type)